MQSNSEEISHACLTHLAREEAQLVVTLEVLKRIRSAMLRSDLAELNAVLEERVSVEFAGSRMADERNRLLKHLAARLGLTSGSLSMRQVVEALPAARRGELQQASQRLRVLLDQVDELSRSSAALAAYTVGFIRRFLADLTGTGSLAGRYGANGTHLEASLRPLIYKRG
jgi:hypothetical protein